MRGYPQTGTEGEPGVAHLWVIEAPFYFLDKFCLRAGLARDSAVPLVFAFQPDRFADARLVYPGAKCPYPEPWVKVLARLYLHNISFKIYQATGAEDHMTSLTLLEPAIDIELHNILGFAAHEKTSQLQRYKKMLHRVFFLLENIRNAETQD